MMKTFLGNISVQKKKKSSRNLFGTGIWLWFWINGLIFSSFSIYIFPDIKKKKWDLTVFEVVCVIWGKGLGANIQIFFLKWNYWKDDAEQLDKWNVVHIQIYLTLSLEKKCSLAVVESLCSVCQGRWLYFQDRPKKKVNILHFWYP